MGCDIHLHTETRATPAEKWEHHPDLGWDWRNYPTFAMLADVRNGYGFAGCDTGDALAPIDEPRGLPDDVSPFVRERCQEWDRDGHSHSHFTLAELLDVPWDDNTITQRGWVDAHQYRLWRFFGHPSSWSGGVDGYGVEHVSNAEMQRLIDADDERLRNRPGFAGPESKSFYTQVEWTQSWAEVAENFLTFVFRLVRHARRHDLDPGDVRIVFWFDS